MSCDRQGRVTNLTLVSPDKLHAQYPQLQALSNTPGAATEDTAVQQLNDPSLWEAVTAVTRAWPAWHYRTQGLVLDRLPCGQYWLLLGASGLQGLHLDNVRCGVSLPAPCCTLGCRP